MQQTLQLQASAEAAARRLRERYPGVTLFAFGQTPFWDEPMKAIVRRLLDQHHPQARLLIGIHDADYFSRNAPPGAEGAFQTFPHNDGTTQSLWVAAGEIAYLFGCEEMPGRSLLTRYGVQLERLAKESRKSRASVIDAATEAWGWRGVARCGVKEPSIAEVPLKDILPRLIEVLEWAERESLKYVASLLSDPSRAPLRAIIEEMRAFADAHPDASLSDLYQHLLPRCYRWVLEPLGELPVSSTTRLFRFNRQTAGLARFRLVDLFLKPETAAVAREAYNAAVAEAQIYDLAHFPPGAIPFDLVIRGRGRGTICLGSDHVVIATDPPVAIDRAGPISSVEQLAALIEGAIGPNAVLIGKAVAFAAMICSEFIFVLNEEGSRYVAQTRLMTRRLREQGIELKLYPALRLKLDAWSALARCDAQLLLPRHLAAAFQTDCLSASDFGKQWKKVVRQQSHVLKTIQLLKSPEDLMDFLGHEKHEQWLERMRQYVSAHAKLLELRSRAQELRMCAERCREQSRQLKREVQELQREKGRHFREHIRPLQKRLHGLAQHGIECPAEVRLLKAQIRKHEKQERDQIESAIRLKLRQAEDAEKEQRRCRIAYRELETGAEARAARSTLACVERDMERERLRIVRDALLTTMGLPFTAHRPTAWWLPLVDPSGGWAKACAETAEFYFEELG